jgi:hypothetical protein
MYEQQAHLSLTPMYLSVSCTDNSWVLEAVALTAPAATSKSSSVAAAAATAATTAATTLQSKLAAACTANDKRAFKTVLKAFCGGKRKGKASMQQQQQQGRQL